MVVMRNINGSITVSGIINGYRVQRVYFGYTARQARRMFRHDVRTVSA